MCRFIVSILAFLVVARLVHAADLPSWIGSVEVTPANNMNIGSITLAGDWLDTCVPDTIAHDVTGNTIDLVVEHDGINVGCGDAITPWSLTEEFGPLAIGAYTIQGTLYAVDPADRTIRQRESGPDVLVESYFVPEPTTMAICLTMLPCLLSRLHRRSPFRRAKTET